MEADNKARRQISLEQLHGLVEFLRGHPDLAKGLIRGRRGKLHTLKIWNQCAKKLNAYKDGVSKDGKGWSKYWCDWKYRVRRRALEIKAASNDNGESTSEERTPLTSLEEDILAIIGETDMEGVVIKSDPLCEGADDSNDRTQDDNEDTSFENSYDIPKKSTSKLKRRLSVKETDNLGPNEDIFIEEKHSYKRTCPEDTIGPEHLNTTEQEFLRLEREKIEVSKGILAEIQRLTHNVGRIADALTKHRSFCDI